MRWTRLQMKKHKVWSNTMAPKGIFSYLLSKQHFSGTEYLRQKIRSYRPIFKISNMFIRSPVKRAPQMKRLTSEVFCTFQYLKRVFAAALTIASTHCGAKG